MSEKSRCQALLLMPESRHNRYNPDKSLRCRFAVKDGNFCGVHAKLANFIESIVWREDGS